MVCVDFAGMRRLHSTGMKKRVGISLIWRPAGAAQASIGPRRPESALQAAAVRRGRGRA